jgi:hypothetical protein
VFINTLDGSNNLDVNLTRLEGKTLNDFTIQHLQSDTINTVNGNFENINTEFKQDESEIAAMK